MSWQQVVIVLAFVGAGVVLGLFKQETLAATALGAAAGFLTQPLVKPKEPTALMTRDEVKQVLQEMKDSFTPPPHT